MNIKKLIGDKGERKVAKMYQFKGYKIIARNFSCKYGELDIVAEKDGMIVVVEVKTRSAYDFARGIDAVSPHKIRRMKSAALAYISMKNDDRPVRFDVIEILAGEYRDDPPKELNHYKDVYTDM